MFISQNNRSLNFWTNATKMVRNSWVRFLHILDEFPLYNLTTGGLTQTEPAQLEEQFLLQQPTHLLSRASPMRGVLRCVKVFTREEGSSKVA